MQMSTHFSHGQGGQGFRLAWPYHRRVDPSCLYRLPRKVFQGGMCPSCQQKVLLLPDFILSCCSYVSFLLCLRAPSACPLL